MQNTDTRIQVTKAMFHQAMLELLEEKAIGFVTVKELCEKAGLNRGTYYLHYSEPIDVLHEMEEQVREDVLNVISGGIYENLPEALAIVLENKRLVAVVIGRNGDPNFLRSIRTQVFMDDEEILRQRYPGGTQDGYQMAYDFLFSGCTGAVSSWLEEKEPVSTAQFAKQLSRICESVLNMLTED